MSYERTLYNLLQSSRCDRSVESLRTMPFDRRFRSRHRDVRKCIRQKFNHSIAKSDVENATATASFTRLYTSDKQPLRSLRSTVSEGGSDVIDSKPNSSRAGSSVSYNSGNEITNTVINAPTKSYQLPHGHRQDSMPDGSLPDVEKSVTKSLIDAPVHNQLNDIVTIDILRTNSSSIGKGKTSFSSGKSTPSLLESEKSISSNKLEVDRDSTPESRLEPVVNIGKLSHFDKIQPEKLILLEKLERNHNSSPKSRLEPIVNATHSSHIKKFKSEKSISRDATHSSHIKKFKSEKSISREKLEENRDRTPESKSKPIASDKEFFKNKKSEQQPKDKPSVKTRSHKKRLHRKQAALESPQIPIQTAQPSAYDVISNFSRLLNTLKAQAKNEKRLASRKRLLPVRFLHECPASMALISSMPGEEHVYDEHIAEEGFSDVEQIGEEIGLGGTEVPKLRVGKRADGKHIHPCICDLTEKQREKIERHLREKLAAQLRYERRVKEIEMEIRRFEEEEEQRRLQRKLEHELYEEEYELVGHRKKRKKRSARRVSMVSIGVRQVINWRKAPKIDVKYTKTYELRKENSTYCAPKIDSPLLPKPVAIAEVPEVPIRQTRASALRAKYTRRYLENMKTQGRVIKKYPNRPEFVLKVY